MKNIHFVFRIKASPQEIFNALTNPLTIELWTGYPAEMSVEEDAEFSLWEGDISGKNIQIETNKKIIQEWYFGDILNPSIVTIELYPEKNTTRIELLHTNIPDEAYENIDYGWKEYYFKTLKKYLEDNLI